MSTGSWKSKQIIALFMRQMAELQQLRSVTDSKEQSNSTASIGLRNKSNETNYSSKRLAETEFEIQSLQRRLEDLIK